jgi:hypothetical protein
MSQFDTVWSITDLSNNQQKALNALLTSTSIEQAAKKSGLSAATIKRYKSSEPFATVYRQQRRRLFEDIIAGIQFLSSGAVTALEDALQQGDLNTRLRAARGVLEYLIRFMEEERKLLDQEEIIRRIEALEIESA